MGSLTKYLKSFEDGVNIEKVRLYVPAGLVYSHENVNLFCFDEIETTEWYLRMYSDTFKLKFHPSHLLLHEENDPEVLSVSRFIINSNNYKERLGVIRIDFNKKDFEQVIDNANTIEGLTYLQNSSMKL